MTDNVYHIPHGKSPDTLNERVDECLIKNLQEENKRLRRALRDIYAVYLDAKDWCSDYERIMRIAKDALLYPQGEKKQ